MLQLLFIDGKNAGQTLLLTFERKWFGRQPTCDVVLDGETVERVHFAIERHGDKYFVFDNKSAHGTFLNGMRINSEAIQPGDQIRAGDHTMEVREVSETLLTEFRFVIDWTTGDRGSCILTCPKIVLGRKSVCHLQLNHIAVSAFHATVERRGEKIVISDSSSQAGTYVNGRRIVEQELKTGDVITICNFTLAVRQEENLCRLSVTELPEPQMPMAPVEGLPSNYQSVVVASEPMAPSTGPGRVGEVLPSAEITALPKWMQKAAPIWVPSSDILPNRFRMWATLGAVIFVAVAALYLWAANRHGVYTPAPTAIAHTSAHPKFHAQLAALGMTRDCAACHVAFERVQDNSCLKCHPQITIATYHRKFHRKISCTACHIEHRGAAYRAAHDVSSGCLASGCHTTFHEKTRRKMNMVELARVVDYENRPMNVPLSVAYDAPFRAPNDVMHTKHAGMKGECLNCHLSVVPFIKESSGPIRMRCLRCHGFGVEATVRARCYSCHFEHQTSQSEKVLAVVKFPDKPFAPLPPHRRANQSLILFLSALVAIPLIYFAVVSVGFRIEQKSFLARRAADMMPSAPFTVTETSSLTSATRSAVTPVAATPAVGTAEPTANQTPGQNLRPLIDIDLCVGCATCVHVCPFNVLEIVNEKAIAARLEDCTGYAACALECPTNAITLVPGGPMQQVELPVYNEKLETNVPGLYLAGEVTGKALIKIAINQGKQVVQSILETPPQKNGGYDVIVVGGGPAGVSTGIAAKAENLKVLVLEQSSVANTIQNYPRHKFVMAEPVMIPLYGPLWMEDASKETLLKCWTEIIQKTGLVVNEHEKVLAIEHHEGAFEVKSTKGAYAGKRVVIAVGKRGSPRKLNVPGEDLSKVAYNLLDAESYREKAICIVGGGDSGIEAANSLARTDLQNTVWIVHRAADFGKAKPRNQKKIKRSMDEGRVKAFFNAGVTAIKEKTVIVKTEGGHEEIDNDYIFIMAGGESPKKFLTECGIEFSRRALG